LDDEEKSHQKPDVLREPDETGSKRRAGKEEEKNKTESM